MALTAFQRTLIRLIARNRIDGGESYVASGTALNDLIGAPRLSHDIDLFHDTREAVHWALDADSGTLREAGYRVDVEIDRDTFIEAVVSAADERTRLQWVQDSAYRFFPLVEHPNFGLTLHPFDLATNKVLALVGWAEPRDWVDTIECDARLQPLGYLAWAAAGKDPGLNPSFIVEESARSGRYTEVELAELSFTGQPPSAAALSIEWRRIISGARTVIAALPGGHVGECVLNRSGNLLRIDADTLVDALHSGDVRFHAGSLRGAFPKLV